VIWGMQCVGGAVAECASCGRVQCDVAAVSDTAAVSTRAEIATRAATAVPLHRAAARVNCICRPSQLLESAPVAYDEPVRAQIEHLRIVIWKSREPLHRRGVLPPVCTFDSAEP